MAQNMDDLYRIGPESATETRGPYIEVRKGCAMTDVVETIGRGSRRCAARVDRA